MQTVGGQGQDTARVEEELADRIGGSMGFDGDISLEFWTIERIKPALDQ